jgi:hypothetical protein
LGASGEKITTASGAEFSDVTGHMDPAFHVTLNSNFSVADQTVTTIQYSNEIFDTDSAFNTSNYRFTVPSGKAGKYHFYHCIRLGDDTATRLLSILNVNGTNSSHYESNNPSSTRPSAGGSVTLDLSVGDYVEHAAFHNTGATDVLLGTAGPNDTFFGGFRIGA